MLTRILTILVVAMLALPLPETTQPIRAGLLVPDEATHPISASAPISHEAASTLAAKKKKKKKQPKFTTVTRTVRQPVTQSFSNTGRIDIPDASPATPYPSAINVAGFANGVITDLNLTLHTYSHAFPRDVDVLLAPTHLPGVDAIVMSDVCGAVAVVSINLTLDDQAATALPEPSTCVSGTFQPTNSGTGDGFPTQSPSGNVPLGVFNNANPNGSWQLFVVDDDTLGFGEFTGGWTLQITALSDVQIEEQIQIPPKKKKHKKK